MHGLVEDHADLRSEVTSRPVAGRRSQPEGMGAGGHILEAKIYGWFSEGFTTPDLREASTLLKDLTKNQESPHLQLAP